jgi:hypothetical protein
LRGRIEKQEKARMIGEDGAHQQIDGRAALL